MKSQPISDPTRHFGGSNMVIDPALLDPRYPDMADWAAAGVEGGLEQQLILHGGVSGEGRGE